jgi:hypothetical protein
MFQQLISLRLSNEQNLYEQIHVFLQHVRLANFRALRHLSLIRITYEQLRRILLDILSLTKLVRLDIDMFDGSGIGLDELQQLANTLISAPSSFRVRTFIVPLFSLLTRTIEQDDDLVLSVPFHGHVLMRIEKAQSPSTNYR